MPTTEVEDTETSALQNLSRFLHTHQTPEATEYVFEVLRVRLSAILGAGGYATLLSRGITLTRRAYPALATVTPDATGSLTGRFAAVSADACVAVLTQFATLLATFIGADLSDNLLTTVWHDTQHGATNTAREQEDL